MSHKVPTEWEQWLTVTRKAVRKHAITAEQGPGTPDEPVAFHLVHAHCRRGRATGDGHEPSRFCTPVIPWACLSRVR